MSYFTRNMITGYYRMVTGYNCTMCGSKTHLLGKEIRVRTENGETFPVPELTARLKKIYSRDDIKIPQHQIDLLYVEIDLDECHQCCDKMLGDDDCTIPFMPHDIPDQSGPIESPNADIEKRIKGKSKKLKRESEKDKKKRKQLARIATDITALLED